MGLLEQVFNVFVFNIQIGVKSNALGRVGGEILLSDSDWVIEGVHSLAKEREELRMVLL